MADKLDPYAENGSLQNRAIELLRSGRVAEARTIADDLLASRDNLRPDSRSIVSTLNAMAACCLALARYPEACRYAEDAIALAEAELPAADDATLAALELRQDACLATGRLADAHDAAKRALESQVAAHGAESVAAAKAGGRIGAVLARIGDASAARDALLRARDVLTRASGPDRAEINDALATTLGNLAGTYHRPDEIAHGLTLYEEALRLRRRVSGDEHVEIARLHSSRGLLLSETGNDELALQACEQSLEMRRRLLAAGHPDLVRSLMEVGWLRLRLRLGEGDRAATALLEALLLLSSLDMPTIEARACFLLASLLAESGAQEAAILFEKLCVNGLQMLRGRSGMHEHAFLAARADIYRHLAESLIGRGRLPEALQAVSMLKETELDEATGGVLRAITPVRLTALEQAHADTASTLRADIRDQLERAARKTPADRQSVITTGMAALRAWFDRLQADFPDAKTTAVATAPQHSPVSERNGAQRLQLQYLLAQDRIDIIVSAGSDQRHYTGSFTSGDLHRRILALRASIADRSDFWRDHARALHDMLIGPIAGELDAYANVQLAVSLDGILRYLPFGVLHDGQRHLLERFALTISAGAADRRQTSAPAGTRLASGFGVTRALANHRALAGVHEELRAIVGTDGNADGVISGRIFLDEAFTADALRSALERGDSIVHIASHFVFRPAQEAESYLLLGDGTKLSLAQLAELKLDGIELLALSACDTAVGSGHRQSGSEFEGLGALALSRGAQHVIATLWPIRDFTSAALMRDFYRLAFREGRSKAEALREAQLGLLAGHANAAAPGASRGLKDPDGDERSADRPPRHSHPYYWAPYVLMA